MKNIIITVIGIIFINACSISNFTFKERILNDLYPILTEEEYNELNEIESDEKLKEAIESFWNNKKTDSTINMSDLRDEYTKRLEYANIHYPDRKGWGRSDRKHIYLIYGPPTFIEKKECTDFHLTRYAIAKSTEIWHYMKPSLNNSLPTVVDQFNKGEMKFIFVDLVGSGIFEIIYSSAESQYSDSRMFETHHSGDR